MTEFEMTEADFAELLNACRPTPALALNCGAPPTPQEKANAAWARLGEKMGFDHMTVRPSRHNQPRFFYAKPVAPETPQ